MAVASYGTFLMYKATPSAESYTKLVDITEFPDLGGDPESLETTDLSRRVKTYIQGLIENSSMTFSANYTQESYNTLNGLTGEYDFAVWFGGAESSSTHEITADGRFGKFSFKGTLSARINGAGTNAVVTQSITITPSTGITFTQGTTPTSNSGGSGTG